MYYCEDSQWVSGVMSASFLILSICCTIFGTYRGGYNKMFNAHTITLTFQITSSIYYLQSIGAFCDFQTFSIEDVPIYRNLITGIIVIFATTLITHRMGETTIDIVFHIIFAFVSQLLWFLATTQLLFRNTYIWMSWFYSIRLLWHIFSESRTDHCRDAVHAMRSFYFFVLYMIVFYVAQFFGPLFVGIIPIEWEEIILGANDLVILWCFFFPILHYGWIEPLNKDSGRTRPGFYNASSPEEQEAYSEREHTIYRV